MLCAGSKRFSEDELFPRSDLIWGTGSVPEVSVQAEGSGQAASRLRSEKCADWLSSALFNPYGHKFSNSSPFQDSEPVGGVINPVDEALESVAPSYAGSFVPLGFPHQTGGYGLLPQCPSSPGSSLPHPNVAGDIPAAYRVRHSMSDAPSSLYEELETSGLPIADRLLWGNTLPPGGSLLAQHDMPRCSSSSRFGGSDGDILISCSARASDTHVRPMPLPLQPTSLPCRMQPRPFLPNPVMDASVMDGPRVQDMMAPHSGSKLELAGLNSTPVRPYVIFSACCRAGAANFADLAASKISLSPRSD